MTATQKLQCIENRSLSLSFVRVSQDMHCSTYFLELSCVGNLSTLASVMFSTM